MPAERVSMRRVREILRLKYEAGASDRAIARSVGVARSTARLCLDRAAAAGLSWPLPEGLTDGALEALLFAGAGAMAGQRRKAEPDWVEVHRELRRPGVTLMLLWEEYRAANPGGYQYSRWCELYRAWEGRLSPTMRQVHPAGERLFVDFAEQTVEVVDPTTGEVRAAQVFVAVLGASNYTYAEAVWTQTLPDWIGAHVRALEFLRWPPWSWRAGRIPSRGSAPASASCGCCAPTAATGWRRPAPAAARSAPAATAPSPRFCSTVSTGSRRCGRREAARSRPCCTRTSAAPATTIEERQPVLTHPR